MKKLLQTTKQWFVRIGPAVWDAVQFLAGLLLMSLVLSIVVPVAVIMTSLVVAVVAALCLFSGVAFVVFSIPVTVVSGIKRAGVATAGYAQRAYRKFRDSRVTEELQPDPA